MAAVCLLVCCGSLSSFARCFSSVADRMLTTRRICSSSAGVKRQKAATSIQPAILYIFTHLQNGRGGAGANRPSNPTDIFRFSLVSLLRFLSSEPKQPKRNNCGGGAGRRTASSPCCIANCRKTWPPRPRRLSRRRLRRLRFRGRMLRRPHSSSNTLLGRTGGRVEARREGGREEASYIQGRGAIGQRSLHRRRYDCARVDCVSKLRAIIFDWICLNCALCRVHASAGIVSTMSLVLLRSKAWRSLVTVCSVCCAPWVPPLCSHRTRHDTTTAVDL